MEIQAILGISRNTFVHSQKSVVSEMNFYIHVGVVCIPIDRKVFLEFRKLYPRMKINFYRNIYDCREKEAAILN